MAAPAGRRLWGRRTITYFSHDPQSGFFAPSKFCAYVMMGRSGGGSPPGAWPGGMDLPTYASIPADAPLFDGARARRHLTVGLGMQTSSENRRGNLIEPFERWLRPLRDHVTVHPGGPVFIHLRTQR